MIIPTWRYHPLERPRLCKSAAEAEALEDKGWTPSPACFGEPDTANEEMDLDSMTKKQVMAHARERLGLAFSTRMTKRAMIEGILQAQGIEKGDRP